MLRGVGLFGWAGIVIVGKMLRSYFINVGITIVFRLELLMSHSLLVHRHHALSCPCIMLRIGPIAPLFRTPSITVGFGLCHAAGWRLRRTRLTVTRQDERRRGIVPQSTYGCWGWKWRQAGSDAAVAGGYNSSCKLGWNGSTP